jgi:hypothetical protein
MPDKRNRPSSDTLNADHSSTVGERPMSNARPVPDASIAPTEAEAKPADATGKAEATEKKSKVELSKAQMLGAGLAVGSAAIAAALLYWGKSQRKS